jgi:hypothetical protein
MTDFRFLELDGARAAYFTTGQPWPNFIYGFISLVGVKLEFLRH